MRITKPLLLSMVMMALLFSSCLVVSLHPLWSANTRILDREMMGKWYSEDDAPDPYRDYIELTASGDTAYTFNIYSYEKHDPEESSLPPQIKRVNDSMNVALNSYTATLVELGEYLFLDLYPNEDPPLGYETNFLPVHTFYKVLKEPGAFSLAELDADRLETLFEQKRIRLRHEITGDYTVLTASTKELQAFMKKYGNDPEAFQNAFSFTRE